MQHSGNIFIIDTHRFQNIFLIPKLNLSHWVEIPMRDIALWAYYLGIFIAFYGTLAPWFLWTIFSFEYLIAFVPIVFSMLLSRTLSAPLFTRKNYLLPTIAYAVCAFVLCILGGKNINGLIAEAFKTIIFMSLFMLNKNDLCKLGDFLSKSMSFILLPSIVGFILYVFGFPLPHTPAVPYFSDYYSYENYYLFMIDDRTITWILPRFHSVFLEPSHMAMACVALLMTQVGQWKKWYNIILFVALGLSFSLAGYVFGVIILFAASWMKRKAIMRKIIVLIGLLSVAVIFSLYYNDGENLVNTLIIQRMAITNDGKLEGDNRVSVGFDAAYENFQDSEKFLIGAGIEDMSSFGSGNAGYKVFLYSYGLISLIFIILFFFVLSSTSTNRRGVIVMLLIQFVSFIPHAIPLKFYFFIPLYILAFRDVNLPSIETKGEKK